MEKLFRLTAFPKTPDGGNKAGVYLEADNLSEVGMQTVAKLVGYSETAFVMKSEVADFKVRFFTPHNEVPLCGHATIATFNLLRDLEVIKTGFYTQETKAGILRLDVIKREVYMEQPSPIYSDVIPSKEFSSAFARYIPNPDLPAQIVSTGLREIFLPVKDRAALDSLVPIHKGLMALSKKYDVIGVHAFCLDEEVDAYGRNFAPIVGISEESATGTSSGALSCYIFKYINKKSLYVLRQGYSMNMPSEIVTKLRFSEDKIESVWVGGRANILEASKY